MNITVVNEQESESKKLQTNATTVQELLKEININPETVLVVRNSEVLTQDEAINENDTIELLSVVSGG